MTDAKGASADQTSLASEWRAAVANHIDFILEFSIRREGAARAVGLRAAPMKSSRGEYLGYVGAIEDSIPAGIGINGPDRTLTYVNRAFTEIVGWPAEEMLGKPFAEFSEKPVDLFENAAPSRCELRLRRKSGEQFDALVTSARLDSENGEVSGWVLSVLDLSETRLPASGLAR